MTYRLHCFGESGNAYKVALMLQLCGAAWEPVVVDFFNGETRTDAYRSQVNAFGEVPVLETEGRRIAQSGVILRHLAQTFGRFGGKDAEEEERILGWLFFDNHKFTNAVATLRFLVALAKTGDPAVIEFLRQRLGAAAGIVDKHLASADFLVGDGPTIADLSLCGYIFHPEEYGFDWARYPAIGRWLQRIRALPGWVAPYDLMPRAPARR